MTVVDLHPEDLLDKDARGELTDAETGRLQAHLARCAACRAERVLRADFFAELEGDDRPSAVLGLVAVALKSADADAIAKLGKAEADADAAATKVAEDKIVADEEKVVAIPGLRRRRRGSVLVMLCAAAAVLAASAAGATGIGTRVWKGLRGDAPEVTHLESTPTSHVEAPTAPVAVAASVPVAPVVEQEPEAPPTMAAHVTLAPPVVQPVSFTTPAPSSTSAGTMFDAANTARRAGDITTALALYDGLEQKYPTSREARSSKATTGRLLLDRGDASGAVRRFDAYLASGAPELREEAMAGRATALERLGRDEEDASAWALLLASYPHTPYAAHARARIARSVPQ